MSKLVLVFVMVLMVGRTNAQDYPAPTSEPPTYFVLIQADDGQAFYIRLGNQLYPSSPAGHLILAQLKDSAYMLTVGLPGQLFPEQRFQLNIHQKDWMLRLSRQDDRWGLVDDQGQAIPAVADPITIQMPAGAKKEDAFSQMMAAIVRDTAVMYNTYASSSADSAQAPAAASASSPILSSATGSSASSSAPSASSSVPTTASSAPSTAAPSTAPSASSSTPSAPTGVVKLSEYKSTKSMSLVYTDHAADKRTDTIDVVIPFDSVTAPNTPPQSSTDTARAAAIQVQSADTLRTAPTRSQSTDTPRIAPTRAESIDTSRTAPTRAESIDTSRTAPTHAQSIDTSLTATANLPSTNTSHTKTSTTDTIRTDDTIHTVRVRKTAADTPHSGPLVPHHTPKSDTPTLASSHKSSLPFINSDCHDLATDYDLDKLRVRMLKASRDDDRIQIAYKVFRIKCFSTRQVSALSEIFTTDPAKFKFLEKAYPFVSDDHFSELVSLFSDPVYAGKFRTLTDRH